MWWWAALIVLTCQYYRYAICSCCVGVGAPRGARGVGARFVSEGAPRDECNSSSALLASSIIQCESRHGPLQCVILCQSLIPHKQHRHTVCVSSQYPPTLTWFTWGEHMLRSYWASLVVISCFNPGYLSSMFLVCWSVPHHLSPQSRFIIFSTWYIPQELTFILAPFKYSWSPWFLRCDHAWGLINDR